MTAPVEVTTRFATSFDTLTECFGFVMDHVDKVGAAPSVVIKPFWSYDVAGLDDSDGRQSFEVVVSGMVHAD